MTFVCSKWCLIGTARYGLRMNLSSRCLRKLALTVFMISICTAGVLSAPSSVLSAQSGTEYKVIIQKAVRVKMRDGVLLVADVYRPDSDGKFPVLLERTPYDRAGESGIANELAAHGYVVVLQDTRGRYASGGEFYPFRDESQDGYDTVEWAAQLEHSNGKVGMFGGSYVGATQMLAAMAQPPHLVAIFPYVTGSDYYDGWTYQSGVLMQWFSSSWTSILAVDTLRRQADNSMLPKEWVQRLPVESYPVLKPPPATSLVPYFHDWIEHERNDSYWQRWRVSDHYAEMNVKGLHAAGWHDLFLKGSIKNYTGLHAEASTPAARSGQRLLIGPWGHAPTSPEGKIGDVVFGRNAVLDMTGTALKWFDYTLKGIKNEYASTSPVRLFVMGDNVWRDEQEFPLARTRYTKYYLHSSRGANGTTGDGSLSVDGPDAERPDQFDYDPKNPVPTIGGRLCCGSTLPPGPFDQRPNESRSDVLVFSTPRLAEDLEVTGFITVELYAATSVIDTDFTALLADVDANGYARFLTDGIVRARYRDTTKQADELVPGKVYKYTIDLWATGNVFKSGHQVRLYISSSNFPRFNRNPNTGERMLGSSRFLTARQTIYHDGKNRSALILPVIPRR
ncbi:MAG: CocE/NonD family hydrolase [Blastocatellia bacterium]|nr:CocE/NonD family hydrolase [Blastocatellia bacterium]